MCAYFVGTTPARPPRPRSQEELKRSHVEYLEAHPELRHLLNDFLSAVLMEKPEDVYSFAQSHFRALRGDEEGGGGK